MNWILGLMAIISLIYCISFFKDVMEIVAEEQKTVDITAHSLLFFMSIFELIRIIFY